MQNDTLKVFTAFSGYDSQCMALDRLAPLGLVYDLVGWSEIDKYAIQAHNAVYPQYAERNYGDISKINWEEVPDFDLFTYSFPCQDISNAGYCKGLEEGSGTRSSLLWECKKAIKTKKPKIMVMENVKALVNKGFISFFNEWCQLLEEIGYHNHWQVLNSKDSVPQNRERVFMVSFLDDRNFSFPKPSSEERKLKEILEDKVDECYYLNKNITDRFLRFPTDRLNNKSIEVFGTTAPHPRNAKGEIKYDKSTRDWVYSAEKLIGTVSATDYKQAKQIAVPFTSVPVSEREKGSIVLLNPLNKQKELYGIRRLTPREYFRLMGVSELDIDKIENASISKTQQYRLAGNSIVVDTLKKVFHSIFFDSEKNPQLKLF